MNTKIVMQRLANVVHSRAKASLALIEMDSSTLQSIKLGLVTVVLIASASLVEISAPFIQRPIATALLMVGLLVGGLVAYPLLPVAALPNVNYPTLTVTAQFPGADPETMASTVASPLELQFGEIRGLTQMTSASALGYVQITLQFELSRQIDGAVSDTLSAINAAAAYLPKDLPYPPMIRKVNPADTPILVLGVTSDSLPLTVVDAYAQNILLQKISQISGVGLVGIGGEEQPTVRVQVDPEALAARGINLEDVRTVLGQAMSTFRKARSTALARPTRSIPTISCSSPTNTPI
jgi:multidrug efflux pump subunit AcrB